MADIDVAYHSCCKILEYPSCKLCVSACEAAAIDLKPIGDAFVGSIEGSGSIPARDLVARAANEIKTMVVKRRSEHMLVI